ncbi:MAG: hypothetical protein R3B52_02460 [Candidatus Paceibacterota bacterium]
MFEDSIASSTAAQAPIFIEYTFLWGIGLLVLSILVSLLSMRISGRQALLFWLINTSLSFSALTLIGQSFPRFNQFVVFGVIFAIILVLAASGAVAPKKEKPAEAPQPKEE